MTDPLSIAAQLPPSELRRLAELGERARFADWEAYNAAGIEAERLVDADPFLIGLWYTTWTAVRKIVRPLEREDPWAAHWAAVALQDAAITTPVVVADGLTASAKMYLGRAWRAYLRDRATRTGRSR